MSEKIISNVIWIDPNIDSEENEEYQENLKKAKCKLKCFKKVDEAIKYLKTIKFEETKVIISGKSYIEFALSFQKNILNMFIVPKIIIFTSNKEKVIQKKNEYKNMIDDLFYNYGGIKTIFNDIQDFIINEKNKEIKPTKKLKSTKTNNDTQFTFEYIDSLEKLALPLFYKTLIDTVPKDNLEKYTESIYAQYSKLNSDVKNLLGPIMSIHNIPIELLCKFYARLYTIESDFYKNINQDLRLNKINDYLSFIKILYEGVKLQALPLASKNILFRGSFIENVELEILENNLKNKKPDLPAAIGFCKSFLSFSKNRSDAEYFLKDKDKKIKINILKFYIY